MCGQLAYFDGHFLWTLSLLCSQTLFFFYDNLSTLRIFISHLTLFLEQSRYKQILDLSSPISFFSYKCLRIILQKGE